MKKISRKKFSNVCLPLSHRSDRRETLATRVLDDLQLSIFRRQKKTRKFSAPKKKSASEICFSSFLADFGGARLVLTAKSGSSKYFASDWRVLRSIRGLEAVARAGSRPPEAFQPANRSFAGGGRLAPTREVPSGPGPATRVS